MLVEVKVALFSNQWDFQVHQILGPLSQLPGKPVAVIHVSPEV